MKKNWKSHSLLTSGKWLKSYWLMRNFIILFFVLNLSAFANGLSQEVSLARYENATLVEVFDDIKEQTGYGILYKIQDLNPDIRVNMNVENSSVHEILTQALEGTNLEYKVQDEVIVIFKAEKISQPIETKQEKEKRKIKGRVTDEKGETLPGVSVVVKGTNYGVSTDINGDYSLEIPEKGGVLLFSFVGMLQQEFKYSGQLVLNVTLKPDSEKLSEVVVTGYQTISKERTTGAFTVITNKKMDDKLDNSVADKLEGSVAGLTSFQGKLSIRGLSTLKAASSPLYVVDGFPVSSISQINANDMESISVLKDAAAASIWGARASNGVIVITTKRGKQSKGKWNYRFNYKIGEKIDRSYLDRLNAREMVDFEVENFDKKNIPWDQVQMFKMSYSKVDDVLYDLQRGVITQGEADKQLDVLRNSDNASQIKDLFLANPNTQEHQLSYSGGNESNRYYTSINYSKNENYIKNESETVMFTLNEDFKVNEKLKFSVGAVFNLNKSNSSNISNSWLGTATKPYEQFVDENGNPSAITHPSKNKEEIERLMSVGLYDETYIPLEDMNMYDKTSENTYTKLSVGANYEIVKGLKLDVKYQMQRTNRFSKDYADEYSFEMRNMINNFAQINANNGVVMYNIPQGGRYSETRGSGRDYNLRAQLDFNKSIGDHSITALAGAERSETTYTSNRIEKFGFNPLTLHYVTLDLEELRQGIEDPQSGNPQEKYDETYGNYFYETKDRFVSFYSNFAYNYKRKYNVTASARIDQTNLFGTDPKYKYKPLWSAGMGWTVSEEDFFDSNAVNHLQFRYTYGTNGNVANENGPYIILESGHNSWTNSEYNRIVSPQNDQLRWESTATQNIGMDIGLWNNRLNASVDLYKRRSKDLLGTIALNPLVGFSEAEVNTGNIDNDGIELQINSTNIRKKNFEWNSSFNFAYNKNKVKKVNYDQNGSSSRVSSAINLEGYAANSLFSYRWAGLNSEGAPQVYNSEGVAVADEEMNDIDALVHSGTVIPVYSGGLTNHLRYKNWAMSFLFVYNGGHKMRNDVASPYNTNHKDIVKRWKKSGDENLTNIPVYDPLYSNNRLRGEFWSKSDYNILDASYLKLKYVTLSYGLPKSLLRKLKVQDVKFNVQAKNLFYWAANKEGIDPEAHSLSYGSRAYPIAKTFTFGLNVTL